MKKLTVCFLKKCFKPSYVFYFEKKRNRATVSPCSHYLRHLRELLIDLKSNIAWLIIKKEAAMFSLSFNGFIVAKRNLYSSQQKLNGPLQSYVVPFRGYFQDVVNRGIQLA